VAEDERSQYEAGPTRRWLKVKRKGWTVDGDGWRLGSPLADLTYGRWLRQASDP